MSEEKNKIDIQNEDEVINVTLSKADYVVLREILEKQKSLNWLGKYVRNILFVTLGGLVTLFTFGDQIKGFIGKILG
jgi:hypothetical protein